MKHAIFLLLLAVGCGDSLSKQKQRPDGDDMGSDVDAGPDANLTNSPPTITNLPADEFGRRGEADAFQLIAADPDGVDTLTFALSSTTCAFDIQVLADSGLVSWQCPAESVSCDALLQVADDGGLTDEATLTIGCVPSLPVFASTAPPEAFEALEYRYDVQCSDPEGAAVTLRVGAADTCGGQLQGTVYAWTPDEDRGGTECELILLCANPEATERQSVRVSVRETNVAPVLDALTPIAADAGESGAQQLSATDADVPAQTLTFTIDATSCGFPVTISPVGLLEYECTSTGSCAATVQVSDGLDLAAAPLDIACGNAPPPLQISGGSSHTCIITPAGGVRCWGSNYDGRVGSNTPTDSDTPVPPTTPAGMTSGVTQISAGSLATCAVQTGAAKCWGSGAWGVIGPTTSDDTITPTTILPSGVTAVATGSGHACAIQSGALKCWGGNEEGQVGNTTGNGVTFGKNPTPTTASGLSSGVTKVATGFFHTCAIQNGALKCFGSNNFGQLGRAADMNSRTPHPVPTTVPGLDSGVTDVEAGRYFTCAIHNGTMKCWGSGSSGELGYTVSDPQSTPTAVPGLTGPFTQWSVGGSNVCVVQNDVQWCWGENLYGQLGTATAQSSSTTPVAVRQPIVTAMSVGGTHICAEQNGSLYCWGDNWGGQLGNATNAGVFGPNPPVLVNY